MHPYQIKGLIPPQPPQKTHTFDICHESQYKYKVSAYSNYWVQ